MEDLAGVHQFPEGSVDFGAVIPFKRNLLEVAFRRFSAGARPNLLNACLLFGAEHTTGLTSTRSSPP